MERRVSRKIFVGNVPVGGDSPISVQSMTNTKTPDVDATLDQIRKLEEAGADIVRVSVPDQEAADAFYKIKKESQVPLVADIHFDHMMALEAIKAKADCIRINPGNIGKENKIKEVVSACKDNGIPIRVGVNAGGCYSPYGSTDVGNFLFIAKFDDLGILLLPPRLSYINNPNLINNFDLNFFEWGITKGIGFVILDAICVIISLSFKDSLTNLNS